MYESLVRPIGELTVGLLQRMADVLSPESHELHETRSCKDVDLPADLCAHPNVQTEWWYYTGHCITESQKRFGFELVFFKRRTDFDRFGILPLRLLANPIYAAHFAISDIDRKYFQYDHRRSFNKPLDLPVEMSEDCYKLRLGDWTVHENKSSHILHAGFDENLTFDAVLTTIKPPVLNGDGVGKSHKEAGATSSHFSFTRMKVDGNISKNGNAEKFSGLAWMDKEFGTWDQKNWDWFSIQFDDGIELMIYHFRNDTGDTQGFSNGTFVDKDGKCIYLKREDFVLTPTNRWKSWRTDSTYPSRWQLSVESLGIDIEIEPLMSDQELDTRGTTMIVYWEGACNVTGTLALKPIGGRAYVELVGYDRSHETAGMADFLFGGRIRQIQEMFS